METLKRGLMITAMLAGLLYMAHVPDDELAMLDHPYRAYQAYEVQP